MKKVLVLNGPNLARLDLRDKKIYGELNYPELVDAIEKFARELGISVDIRQSDDETVLIHWIHEAADQGLPIIINGAAFTHYSYAIRDALAMVKSKIIEVHLSNPLSREEFRHTSVISGVASGTISGFGLDSYLLALRVLAKD
jgi:3-dehydroquinate dehydratase II